MDWRQPWLWPKHFQYVLFIGAGFMGVLLLSPWWMQSWKLWSDVTQAQDQLLDQHQATLALREQTAQLRQTTSQNVMSLADAKVLSQLAQHQGLQSVLIGMDKPQQTPSLSVLQMQQVPVHLKVQGSWDAWLNWLSHWPSAVPGVIVASLDLKADSHGGISAQMVAITPQFTQSESAFALSSVGFDGTAQTDPFDAQAWLNAQRQYAAQHPGYARLVAPELLRPRDVLEAFPRERLQYVGQIGTGVEPEALVKVLPPTSDKKDTAMFNVHRVRVGHHLGQDFGRVLAVQSDQLVVQELALTPAGEWQTREVRLPLQQTAP